MREPILVWIVFFREIVHSGNWKGLIMGCHEQNIQHSWLISVIRRTKNFAKTYTKNVIIDSQAHIHQQYNDLGNRQRAFQKKNSSFGFTNTFFSSSTKNRVRGRTTSCTLQYTRWSCVIDTYASFKITITSFYSYKVNTKACICILF